MKLPSRMASPRMVGVDHDFWYENQEQALIQAVNNENKFMFFEMPTGSGKSALPTALSSQDDVLVTVGTLNLLSQYESEYGFDVIRGRTSYPCELPSKLEKWRNKTRLPNAGDCHYSPMHDCPISETCAYLVAKEKGKASNKLAVTYKYAFLSRMIRKRLGIIACDEAHEAAEQIIGFATFEVAEYERATWDLPTLPLLNFGPGGKGDLLSAKTTMIVVSWIDSCLERLNSTLSMIDESTEEGTKCKRMIMKFQGMLDNLHTSASQWFFECKSDLIYFKGSTSPGLKIRPLDPSIIANRLWENKQQAIFMSATIGDPAPLAQALGVNHYFHQSYPHPIPISARPVLDLGFPKMTWGNIKKDPSIFLRQAIKISSWVKTVDPSWRGIVLTSSYAKIKGLGEQLSDRMTGRRIIVQQPGVPLADITKQFIEDQRDGDILLASIQGFGQGLNLRGDLARFAVIAGVPFDNYTDRYERLRKKMNGKYGWWKSYNSVPQGCGRVSRGSKTDKGNHLINYGILADGSATTAQAFKYYSDWFKNAIQRV